MGYRQLTIEFRGYCGESLKRERGNGHRAPASKDISVRGAEEPRSIRVFHRDESGQDLVEYALLLAAIALAGAAAFIGMSSSANVLWSVANSNLAAGNQAGS